MMEPVCPAVESPTVELVPCTSAGIEKEQTPLVVDVAEQGFVVETQLAPEKLQLPSLHWDVMEPLKPLVLVDVT